METQNEMESWFQSEPSVFISIQTTMWAMIEEIIKIVICPYHFNDCRLEKED
jgi:hypothetical protein